MNENEERLQRLEELYSQLEERLIVRNKKELAKKLGCSYTGLINAFSGRPKSCTESLLIKVQRLLENGSSEEVPNGKIPLIPITAWGGSLDNFDGSAELAKCEMVTSPIAGATFAIQVAGDSMAPDYPAGSQVIVKRINEKAFIEWGKVYVLDTENGAIIKEIRKSEEDGCVCCHSINENGKYLPFDVDMKSIRGFYRVLMVMSLK